MMKGFVLAVAVLGAAPAGAGAQAAPTVAADKATPNVLDKAVNVPGTNWSIYGAAQKSKLGKTQGVPGD
jgi:hypothetical protein